MENGALNKTSLWDSFGFSLFKMSYFGGDGIKSVLGEEGKSSKG